MLFNYFYHSKRASDIERQFKGLLNFLRERIKHVYGIYLLGTALIKSTLFQTVPKPQAAYFQVKVNI